MIHSKDLHPDKILMKDIFVLPLGNNLFKAGSTYQWDNLDENPTDEGKSELVKKLDLLLDCPYTIIDHRAGIRPTVKDRKPLIGMHPKYNTIGILNGMGTKGASLAPFFAKHFVEFLEEGKVLDMEVNITRFEKHLL